MKINRQLLPLKVHYFFFLGCMSPILPFLIVVAMQLGIPVSVQGSLGAALLLITVLIKPVIAALSDTFPGYRKAIFVATLTCMFGAYSSIWFIPPMREIPALTGQLIRVSVKPEVPSQLPSLESDVIGEEDFLLQPLFQTHNKESCFIAVAWNCVASCSEPGLCINENDTQVGIKVKKVDDDKVLHLVTDTSESPLNIDFVVSEPSGKSLTSEETPNTFTSGYLYQLEGINVSWDFLNQNISLECVRAEWSGDNCHAVWKYWVFWIYVCMQLIGQISFNTGNSITDAIAVDTIGESQASYGNQRAWGTVGWGLMGPISGLLIDLWSGSSITKDYAPAFLICFVLGSMDIFTCASSLKVPETGSNSNLITNVGPLLSQPRFLLFCCFIILNGCFDSIAANFVFVLQEKMAEGTSVMKYTKFLQGMTIFIQSGVEVPFMFVCGWCMRKLGVQRVTSLVFFLYIFRLLGLCFVGYYGPVWATLLPELLNGPCYGLGYTAIVVYAAKISPPGTSATVQSMVNICYESFGYALASLIGGLLFEVLGGPGMYLVAGITSAITFVLHLVSLKFLPPPEEHVNGVTDSGKTPGAGATDKVESARNEIEDPDKSRRGSIKSAKEAVEENIPIELKQTAGPEPRDFYNIAFTLNEEDSS